MKTYIVDSFTNQAFKGNPAGVCFPLENITEQRMLAIATEFGLSETAFVQPTSVANAFTIRFFSPKKEIPLCGHATLAASKVIFASQNLNEIHFTTVEDLDLLIKRKDDEIVMEFPVFETEPIVVPETMLHALGLHKVVNTSYSTKNKIILIEIASAEILTGLKPDFQALINSYQNINGVLVTALSDNIEYDYEYRYFWPWAGTNEDPVTGGVQTFLAKYWSVRLHKNIMKAFQSSARTGYMQVELKEDKVLLSSQAVIVLEGELKVG